MVNEEKATRAVRVLNDVAERYRLEAMEGQLNMSYARSVYDAVRTLEEIKKTYFLIHHDVIKMYEEKKDGVRVCAFPEE